MCRLLLKLLFLWLGHNYCQFIIWNKRRDRGGGTEEGVQRSGEVCFFLLSMGTCGGRGSVWCWWGAPNEAKQVVRFHQLADSGRLDVTTVGSLFEGTIGSDGFCEAGDLLEVAMKVGR